jgi:hypothetical protein
MPGKTSKRGKHTAKAERMAAHITRSAKSEGRYKGREKEVAWRKVHKELSHEESHKKTGRPSR